MQKRDQPQIQHLLLAEAYFRVGKLDEAIATYPGVIPNDRFIACGDKCKIDGNYEDAFKAYWQAGATAKLIELGDQCAKSQTGSEDHRLALRCFLAVNARERLLALGDKYLDSESPDASIALEAFTAAKATDKLIALGDACLPGAGELALQAYKNAGAVEKLLMLGDQFLAKQAQGSHLDLLHYACEAYRAAQAADKMLLCADLYIQHSKESHGIYHLENALAIYREVGAKLPMDLLNEVLDHQVAAGLKGNAMYAAQLIASTLVPPPAAP